MPSKICGWRYADQEPGGDSTQNAISTHAMHFGGRLRELRAKSGLSQEDLAERAGVAQSAISRMENSERPGRRSLESLARVLSALGASAEEFWLDNPAADREGAYDAPFLDAFAHKAFGAALRRWLTVAKPSAGEIESVLGIPARDIPKALTASSAGTMRAAARLAAEMNVDIDDILSGAFIDMPFAGGDMSAYDLREALSVHTAAREAESGSPLEQISHAEAVQARLSAEAARAVVRTAREFGRYFDVGYAAGEVAKRITDAARAVESAGQPLTPLVILSKALQASVTLNQERDLSNRSLPRWFHRAIANALSRQEEAALSDAYLLVQLVGQAQNLPEPVLQEVAQKADLWLGEAVALRQRGSATPGDLLARAVTGDHASELGKTAEMISRFRGAAMRSRADGAVRAAAAAEVAAPGRTPRAPQK